MFVPRALRLKGVKEAQKPKPAIAKAPEPTSPHNDVAKRGPRFQSAPVTTEYLGEIVAGVELIFTDYAHQEPTAAQWLQKRYRTVGGEEKFVHFSAIAEHSNLTGLKPQVTQIHLQQALREHATEALELSSNGFHVRRNPSTYPSPFVPHDSFNIVDDYGLSFWDQRTIYVEPHIRHLCKTPAKVAYCLKKHGKMKAKWLPIQAVKTLYNGCAFVVLSGNVTHEDVWKKWRDAGMPEDWKILTKVEHKKRTEEYVELLRELKKANQDPRPIAVHQMKSGEENVPDDNAAQGEQRTSKKRKRTKKKSKVAGDEEEAILNDGAASDPDDGRLSKKQG
ncbi:hypothetical protein P280DRAFT_56021 [Massarina eburnea CBS 473.64]|uniref:Uncharacterized protein n=1 Tax=Massarina eburnea CBS 473.64 TaxID=1395130 RepID=A0A6A6RUD3_9PLEO|nr:hypothetical protein P280DRAFT_56021 [Massarina eburnea CBS 473.64]